MSFKKAVQSYLAADAGVSALVAARIYPSMAPESADLPYIVYEVISGSHEQHMTAAGGLVQRRLQITCFAATSVEAEALGEAVRDALQGFTGAMGTDNLDVRSVTLDNDLDGFDNPTDGSSKGTFSKIMDFLVWHAESIPTFP